MKNVEGFSAGVRLDSPKKLSPEDLIYHCGNWIWRAVEALSEARDFEQSPEWIADRLNVSVEQAKAALEGLQRIGVLTLEEGVLKSSLEQESLGVDDLDRSDLYSIHCKIKEQISELLNSRQCFSNTILLTSTQNMNEFYSKFSELIKELNEKEISPDSKEEVFALELSAVRLTRTTK